MEWLPYVPIAALVVAGTALYFTRKNYLLARERKFREEGERAEKEREKAAKRAAHEAWLAQFSELEVDGGDTRHYVWKYPLGWEVPLDHLTPTAEERFWLSLAIWKIPDQRPVEWGLPVRLGTHPVYATDEGRNHKSLIVKPTADAFLAITSARGERRPEVCYPDRHVFGGEFCSYCHRPVAELRAEAAEFERTKQFPPPQR